MGFAKAAEINSWKEIDPLITLLGNTAIVTYYFDMSFDMGGQTIKMAGRDMYVFLKENGKWWAVADQFSPYPM
jgi:ketosteroid isomerase-like protein